MPSPTRLLATLAAAALLALPLAGPAGCADPASHDAGEAADHRGGDGVPARPGDEEVPAGGALGVEDAERELTVEEKKRRAAESHARVLEQRERWDEYARGYIDSFKSRVYAPERDGGLTYLEGAVTARVGDASARFQVRYDGERAPGKRVSVTPATDPEGLPDGTARTVERWAKHSLEGAYRTVVYYLPPVELSLIRSNEKGERLIVYCPPLKTEFSVSYSFDERELVMIRGANGPQLKEITHFEWELVRGRYFLNRMWFFGVDSELTFTYGQHGGVVLVETVKYRKDDATMTLEFDYSRVD